MKYFVPRLVLLFCMATFSGVLSVQSESLEILETRHLPLASDTGSVGFINVLMLGDDTVAAALAGENGGVWVQFDRQQPWIRLIGSQPSSDSWWVDCDGRTVFDKLFSPLNLGFLSESQDLLVFDGHCNQLLTLELNASAPMPAHTWRYMRGEDSMDRVSFQDGYLFTGIYSEQRDMMLSVERLGDAESYRRILPISAELQVRLDSVGLGYTDCMAAMDPASGNIWVAICDYDYILISNPDGVVLDSVCISSSGYVSPQPPKSRVRSQAVWEQWMRSKTYKTAFKYIAPGYFILQYDVSNFTPLSEGTMSVGTSVWNTDRQSVGLKIDPHWQLAGAHEDGRIVFGRHIIEGNKRRIELNIVRIEP